MMVVWVDLHLTYLHWCRRVAGRVSWVPLQAWLVRKGCNLTMCWFHFFILHFPFYILHSTSNIWHLTSDIWHLTFHIWVPLQAWLVRKGCNLTIYSLSVRDESLSSFRKVNTKAWIMYHLCRHNWYIIHLFALFLTCIIIYCKIIKQPLKTWFKHFACKVFLWPFAGL